MINRIKFVLLVSLTCLSAFTYADDPGVAFRNVSYAEVFDIARSEGKSVLLYFHFDGCAPCVKIQKMTFPDVRVQTFLKKFVCLSVNTRKGEGIMINKIYNIQLHPTFLFLDDNGIAMHRMVGFYTPDDFLTNAEIALNPLNTYVAQYRNGEKDPDFLYYYNYKIKGTDIPDSGAVAAYLSMISPDEFDNEKNIRFIYDFAIDNGTIKIPFGSPAYLFMVRNRDKFYTYFEKDQVDARIVLIAVGSPGTELEFAL